MAPLFNPRAPLPWLKPGLWLGSLVPAAALGVAAFRGTLGANAVERALNQLGLLALTFLVASLACTPLNSVLGWKWPVRVRRMVGLFAFFYAVLHFSVYVGLDQGFDLTVLWEDVTQRKFIAVGFAALVLMVPLALTSTNAMVRRLGYPRWKRLHRLAYASGVLAAVHFLWRVKADLSKPLLYASALGLLFLIRLGTWLRRAPR
ncbi:MAG TPA: protein-methionine-sulfoxide reductase heme-binding subunit MsrQ [Myxococcaceae bacterium]|nr:protein-methionine-sulfoxide reductase heme-binding subunit MsrQ [Myxococcaceae bacterium]